ncbi:MAG: hypothetical protein AB1690_02930 [Candidatus Zixiibacteriota bacterium]
MEKRDETGRERLYDRVIFFSTIIVSPILASGMNSSLISELSAKGYWPALAMEYFLEKKFSRAIELCRLRLSECPELISGRTILARALFHTGQMELSQQEFYRVLEKDPDNLVALKYLGDIKFYSGDSASAFSYYERFLLTAPASEGLASSIADRPFTATKIVMLRKGEDKRDTAEEKLRDIPFRTETLGNLLMAQGYYRLALKVFNELAEAGINPRISEKIEIIEASLSKDKKNA